MVRTLEKIQKNIQDKDLIKKSANSLMFDMKDDEYESILSEFSKTPRFHKSKDNIQHGTTSVFEHSLSVCYFALKLKNLFHMKPPSILLVYHLYFSNILFTTIGAKDKVITDTLK